MALQQTPDVQSISSYNNPRTCSMQISLLQTLKSIDQSSYNDAPDKSLSKNVLKAIKHKKAESKRRVRINKQYDNLRTVLPNLIKRNKASVLEETIQRVKELTNTVSELKKRYGGSRMECVFPGGAYKLSVERCSGQDLGLVKVMFSCEDGRRLMSDVARAVKSVKGKVVRAEMVTMGGRTICVFWVQGISSNQDLQLLRRDVEAATERPKTSRRVNRAQLLL